MVLKISVFIVAFVPWYWSFRASSTVLFAVSHFTNLYGPVPVGCAVAYSGYLMSAAVPATLSALYFLSASGLDIENDGSASAAGNLLDTREIWITAVCGSLAVQDLNRLSPIFGSTFWAKPPQTSP